MADNDGATLHLDRMRTITAEEGEAASAGTPRTTSRIGDFTELRERLVALDVGGWLQIPFSGDAKAARSRLTSAVKYTQQKNPGYRFGVRRHKTDDVFMVHRVAESAT